MYDWQSKHIGEDMAYKKLAVMLLTTYMLSGGHMMPSAYEVTKTYVAAAQDAQQEFMFRMRHIPRSVLK